MLILISIITDVTMLRRGMQKLFAAVFIHLLVILKFFPTEKSHLSPFYTYMYTYVYLLSHIYIAYIL